MKLFSRTITFNEKDFQAEIARIDAQYAHLREEFEALDDSIRDALDFLTGHNGQGKIDPEIAKDILNEALEKHGAQLLR